MTSLTSEHRDNCNQTIEGGGGSLGWRGPPEYRRTRTGLEGGEVRGRLPGGGGGYTGQITWKYSGGKFVKTPANGPFLIQSKVLVSLQIFQIFWLGLPFKSIKNLHKKWIIVFRYHEPRHKET
jgi:hypothetical protein